MPVCKNCEETFRTKKSLNAHLKECIEVSDIESESSSENEKKPRKIKKDEPLSQNVESNNDLVVIDEQNDDGDPKKEEAATDNTFSQSVNDVIDKKDIKRDFRCKKCQKIMVNEEHRLSHECQAKISEFTGTLEEQKQKLFKYYQEAFIKARNEIYDRIYPAFKYDAMVDLGISVSGLSELSRSKHANVEETKKTADLDFERKHRMLTTQYEQKILETAKIIRCQTCNEPAKFYCCKDGGFCSEECQTTNLHYIDCFKKLNDPYKDAAIQKIKRIPKLNFDD